MIFSTFFFIFLLIVQNSHFLLIIHIFWRAHTTESATLWSSKEFKYSFTKYSLNGREIFPDEIWSWRRWRWNDTKSEKIEKNTFSATMLIHFQGDNLFHFLGLWKIQVNSVIVIDRQRLSHCSDKQKRPRTPSESETGPQWASHSLQSRRLSISIFLLSYLPPCHSSSALFWTSFIDSGTAAIFLWEEWKEKSSTLFF